MRFIDISNTFERAIKIVIIDDIVLCYVLY